MNGIGTARDFVMSCWSRLTLIPPAMTSASGHVSGVVRASRPSGVGVAATMNALDKRERAARLKCIIAWALLSEGDL